jgi:tetratricopeptide (TPR) repeat protein
MRLILAAAQASDRLEIAASWLERLRLPEKERQRFLGRLAAARADAVAPERAVAIASIASGRHEEALSLLLELGRRFPEDRRLRYDTGRLLQILDRFDEARPYLEATVRGEHDEIAGWAALRLGWDQERSGRRERAREWYRRASQMKRFSFRPAARDRLEHAVPEPPEG